MGYLAKSGDGDALQILHVPQAGASLSALAGTVLDGKYRLGDIIGSGAMAHVFAAEQLRLGRAVAVKMLRTPLASDSRSLERFHTEALAASRVNHPHAVAIYDVGVTPAGIPYLVLERLRGPALADICASEKLATHRIITIGAQILSALDEAHGCGVIHRDLKTENVVVETRRDGGDFVKVVDFGIAALVDQPEGGVVGTPEYMSPEQIRGEVPQPTTDLYAVGVLLYELITGETPFAGGTLGEILERHLGQAPRPPGEVAACPDDLAKVIMRALAKEPGDRWESAAVMRTALLECMRDRLPTHTPQPIAAPRAAARVPDAKWDSRGSRPTVEDRPRQVERAQAASRATGLIGRSDVVAEVAGFLAGAPDNRRGALTLVGPVGVGKASIVRAAALRLQAAGMTIHLAGPDPSGFAVSWVPIVSVLSAILGLPAKPDRDQFLEAIERAGLSERDASGLAELFGFPGPIAFLDGGARHAEARAAALALLTTGSREGEPVALGFLDVDRFDALSRELVLALAARLEGSRTRVIVTTSAPAQVPDDAARMTIASLGPTAAHALFARHAGAARAARVTPAELIARTAGLPVALIHLGHWLAAGNDLNQAPARTVDLVADQLGQLPVAARRVLQALAIQGKVASRARLTEVVGTDAEIGLAGLLRAGLVAVGETEVTIVDEVVAQIAIACTPVETRREHAAAILRASGPDLSAAAVAHLAELAGSLHVALAANITAGDHARHRFDHARAGTLYHRAVTIARRLQAQGEAGATESLVIASLRLADVLIQAGKHAAASGCLDEAELSGPTATHLASLGRQRGRIAAGVGQAQLAVHLLQRAIGLALRAGQPEVCLDAYLDLADVLAGADQVTEAVEELTEALAVLSLGEGLAGGAGPERLWEIGWRLAHLHARAGDAQQAREVARAALLQAQRGHSMLGQGRLHVLLASLSRRLSDVSCALAHRAMARDAAEELAQRGMAGQIA